MPASNKQSHAEGKRLRKAVKRRRTYAENLKRTIADMKAAGPLDDAEILFIDQLFDLAEAELAQARADEQAAKSIDVALTAKPHGDYSSAEMKARAERAAEAIKGRMTVDRVRHMLAELGQPDETASTGEGMDLVETLMGTQHPEGRPQMGVRVANAETALFGAVRFA